MEYFFVYNQAHKFVIKFGEIISLRKLVEKCVDNSVTKLGEQFS